MRSVKVYDSENSIKKKEIPKLIQCYFLISQLCFGIDFGFGASLQSFARKFQFVTFIMTLIYTAALLAPVPFMSKEVVFWSIFFEYAVYVILLKVVKYKIYSLMIDVNELYEMSSVEKRNMSLIAFIYTPFLICIKLAVQMLKCFSEDNNLIQCARFDWILTLFYGFPYLGLDVIAVSQVIIAYYIYCFVRSLKQSLDKGEDVNTFLLHYIAIIECYDKIKPIYNAYILLKLATGVPALMDSLVYTLKFIKTRVHWTYYVNEIVFSSVILLHILIPCLIVEKINIRVDDMKVILQERMVKESDAKGKTNVANVLRYVTARPMLYLVWRFLPVDVNLILSLFGFCTTYFIVIVQFLHLD